MRTDQIKMAMHNQPFMVDSRFLDNALSILNSGAIKDVAATAPANNNVTYEVIGDKAIISLDGAMYKKSMNGACGESVVSYTNIVKAIRMAENDSNVSTMIFRVDTPGGSVAGADEVEDMIFNSSKKTVTFFENQGTSGGMYIFLASDEVFAAPNTVLGSIGVIMTIMEEDDSDKKLIHMTSANAKNKVCKLGEGCEEKLQHRLDVYENRFYELVIKNTGKTAEDIKATFDNGGVAFAEKALEDGFINGIMTFRELLNQTVATMPTAESDKMENKNQGVQMSIEELLALGHSEENFAMVQAGLKTTHLAQVTAEGRLSASQTALEEKSNEFAALQETHTKALEQVEVRVMEAMASGVMDASIIMQMIQTEDDAEASKLAISANEEIATLSVDASKGATVSGIAAYAEKNKGKVRV